MNQANFNVEGKSINCIYTEKYSVQLMENHFLAKVSHHHYWFKSLSDLMCFMQSAEWFDSRMTFAHPTGERG